MGERTAFAFFAVGWHCSTNTGAMNAISLSREQANLLVLALEKLPKSVVRDLPELRQQELFSLCETLHLFVDNTEPEPDRLFIGLYPEGIVYADRKIEEHGDYRQVAFLPYSTLVFQPHKVADKDLLDQAKRHAATIQAKRGERFQISSCGQYVILGE
jgi:hypothetical protein